MTAAMAELIRRVIEREGGVADVGDGKGVTRWGQTRGWLTQFNLPIPADATDAADNYEIWLYATGLDAAIGPEADAFADNLIDFAVHSGHVPAVKLLQRALGVKDDGKIGPVTRAAIAAADRRLLAFRLLAGEWEYQGRLITDHPEKYAQFAAGWANRNAKKLLALP